MQASMKTYFEIFKLNKTYLLNIEKLEEAYINLQAVYHPDKFINHSEADKLKISNFAEQINTAYEILKDDVKRGEYLLNLQGYSILSDNFIKIKPPQSLLQEFMMKFEDLTAQEADTEIDIRKKEFDNLLQVESFESAGIKLLEIRFLIRIITPWTN